MKLKVILSLSLLSVAAFTASAIAADAENPEAKKKVMVAVKTNDVELHELDISHLQPGDAETILTEDGNTVDVLRTEDDVEIYINGELLETGPAGSGHHGIVHGLHENIEIECDDAADCDELVWLGHDGEVDPDQLHDAKKVVIIKKELITN
ncbi:MAG TPA: hypothetical protein VFG52_11570 [Xanthomonadales bacterium]|nr:hypothetical protein [Xanthomonadales bacterium]